MASGYQREENLPKGHMDRYSPMLKSDSGKRVIKMKMEEIQTKGEHHFRKGYVNVIKHLHSKI